MSGTLASQTSQSSKILCFYMNATSQSQILRIADASNWFERVVFPGQRFMFEAKPEARLEIHTGLPISSTLSDKIPCIQLRVV
ncbi:DUF1830 domain-containing protein [Chroococcidiopsis sp. FACHB-1243]|nr:DUF1830 domain-containing protein [Chroococcidiopsis sp. [FACHB-1243]]MBD2308984.1 DUF1830 domain-containing protein [Chroococcidiopsis sp. [FACHB-1243]]